MWRFYKSRSHFAMPPIRTKPLRASFIRVIGPSNKINPSKDAQPVGRHLIHSSLMATTLTLFCRLKHQNLGLPPLRAGGRACNAYHQPYEDFP
jgi:hypothetical protein